jgi:hypothetical protein
MKIVAVIVAFTAFEVLIGWATGLLLKRIAR